MESRWGLRYIYILSAGQFNPFPKPSIDRIFEFIAFMRLNFDYKSAAYSR